MQLVVVKAVIAAVSIATITSTALRLMACQAFSFSFLKRIFAVYSFIIG